MTLIDGIVDESITDKYENSYIIDKVMKFKNHILDDSNENYEENEFLNNFCESLM